jgi:hypothetical protein
LTHPKQRLLDEFSSSDLPKQKLLEKLSNTGDASSSVPSML